MSGIQLRDGQMGHARAGEAMEYGPTLGASVQAHALVTKNSPPAAKINLFQSLFRGRQDVYPRRFESRKTGRAGYAPACANEWVLGVCEKPRIKCADCPNRRFFAITGEVISWHLSGRDAQGRDFVMGIYPMLLDESCFFLAVDFDGESWQEDVKAFIQTCARLSVPAAMERSRSGNGAHVWFFFEEAIPACLARKLGSYILTETMENRPEIGLKSYDRLFPNQDTLPKGGFGNLIALPLQKVARERGNSVFIDEHLRPYDDQWAFLASIRRMSRAGIEAIVREPELKGRVIGVRVAVAESEDADPWTAPPSRSRKEPPIVGPLPDTLELTLGDQIYVRKRDLVPALRNRLVCLAAFQNPEFYRAQAMRRPTYETRQRFRLNAELPVSFDNRGQMEVDFLCADSRVVIELDGPQHLSDAEAYRRDRRKDALLQQHGYFVLRFLAEDTGKQLDRVLDAILATLAHRDRHRNP